jgi:hypothetical protein
MIDGGTVDDNLDNLILDLLEWLGSRRRPYAEVLDAWRTSCPRFPVWEDANDRGYVERHHVPGHGQYVSVSVAGHEHLRKCRGQQLTDLESVVI